MNPTKAHLMITTALVSSLHHTLHLPDSFLPFDISTGSDKVFAMGKPSGQGKTSDLPSGIKGMVVA